MYPMHQGETASPPTQIQSPSADSHHHEAKNPETNTQDRRKDILAFRTIMHLSAAFMLLEPRNDTGHTRLRKEEKIQLGLSSAFASLAVLEHEVLAVVVRHDDDVANPSDPVRAIVTSKPQALQGPTGNMNGVFTQNPRFDDKNASTQPILSTPGVPSQFKEFRKGFHPDNTSSRDFNILNFYMSNVLLSQGSQSILLDDHIWMLQKILNARIHQREEQSLKQLMLYVVIACFRKTLLPALRNVNLKEIDFDKAKPDTTPTNEEIDYTYTHLTNVYLFAKTASSDHFTSIYDKDTFEEFHQLLLSLLENYRKELERMKTATGNDGPSKETFKKAVANVLWAGVWLQRLTTGAALRMHLQTIENSLSGLATSALPKSQENEAGIHPIQDEVDISHSDDDLIAYQADDPFDEDNNPFDEELHNSPHDEYQHDNLLSEEKLDDGRDNAPDKDGADGFEHSSEEEDPSDDGHVVASAKPKDPADDTTDDVYDGEPDIKDEDDFEEIKSEVGHVAALKWIKLLVSQFSAAYMLVYELPSNSRISLQILKSPQVGSDLMPWKELLADKKFFPIRSPYQVGSRLWNNEEIAKFMEKGTNSNRHITLGHARAARDAWQGILNTYQFSSDHQALVDRVVRIVSQMRRETDVPGCEETAADILSVLEGATSDILADSVRTTRVTDQLLYIIDLCTIFIKLAATKFTGSLHCEAALGTLISTHIDETHPQYSTLLDELQHYRGIIGTSKRCCPVCARLLSTISPVASSQSFVTRGSHRTITPCTLPDWTPPQIVEQLNNHFGQPLRKAICQLMERTHWAPLKYSPSTGSSALSVASLMMTYDEKVAYRVKHGIPNTIDEWISQEKTRTKAPTANPHKRGLCLEYLSWQDDVECIFNVICEEGLVKGDPTEFTLTLRVRVPPTAGFLMYYWQSPTVIIDQYRGNPCDSPSPEWLVTVQTERRFWQSRVLMLEMMLYFVRNIPHNARVSKKVWSWCRAMSVSNIFSAGRATTLTRHLKMPASRTSISVRPQPYFDPISPRNTRSHKPRTSDLSTEESQKLRKIQ
ncbi:hypothetical protein BDZ97DRAFT_1931961 [Flammula alnicola]|nr:hypothetical protein BDZ97DRAFT_1931961 [Flammula alnicola]